MKDTEWTLSWSEDREYIHFKEIDKEGKIILEFALQPPRHAKLYYALKDWFMD